MSSNDVELTDFDRNVLTKYPYPIAVRYRRILEERDPRTKVDEITRVFDFGMRTLALGLIQQYINSDVNRISDPYLNSLLIDRLRRPSLGSWKDIFFSAIKAYKGNQNMLFMPELYDMYWDTSQSPHVARPDVEDPFNKLVNQRNTNISLHEYGEYYKIGWEGVAEQMFENLRKVLLHFQFLTDYSLVQILDCKKGSHYEYNYVTYIGEYPKTSGIPMVVEKELNSTWLYLSRDFMNFSPLYPLMIFWEDQPDYVPTNGQLNDTAIYNYIGDRKTVNFLAASYPANIEEKEDKNPILVKQIRALIEAVQKLGRPRVLAARLDWALLQSLCGSVAALRFTDVAAKYRADLYLQREDVRRAFDDFLNSKERNVFLLLGKSGVGKSSFLVSLVDEYQQDNKIALLLYDGARLSTATPLRQILNEDIDTFLQMPEEEDFTGTIDFLKEINRIEGGMNHRKVVLFIDAINENAHGGALIQRIDDLISSTYPWFKVVISSRPEAWKELKRGLHLSTHRYYSVAGNPDFGVELQPFAYVDDSVGVQLPNFRSMELEQAYSKYQAAYNLQTPFELLSRDLRGLLNDPLNLKLIAETYKGREIPSSFKQGEIYEKYLAQLRHTGRLLDRDRKFLEDEVVPLMLSEDHYANDITATQLDEAKTASGQSLYELVANEEQLYRNESFGLEEGASGESRTHVNQSFRNLADAEILIKRVPSNGLGYEVAFKYERFYDYFGGKQIARLAQKYDKPEQRYLFFLNMIKSTGKASLNLPSQMEKE